MPRGRPWRLLLFPLIVSCTTTQPELGADYGAMPLYGPSPYAYGTSVGMWRSPYWHDHHAIPPRVLVVPAPAPPVTAQVHPPESGPPAQAIPPQVASPAQRAPAPHAGRLVHPGQSVPRSTEVVPRPAAPAPSAEAAPRPAVPHSQPVFRSGPTNGIVVVPRLNAKPGEPPNRPVVSGSTPVPPASHPQASHPPPSGKATPQGTASPNRGK